METILRAHGHEPGTPADAVIVNTCAVTAEAGRKSRQVIRRLREENPGALIAVSGCYAQLSPEEAEELGVGIIFGTGDRAKFIEAIEKGLPEKNIDDPFRRFDYEVLPAGPVSGRTRAMMKIQDGCVNFCSYCIIPYTRGRLRSLPMAEAVSETKRLAEEGYRELVLTGIEVASYGLDLEGKPGLADVITACAAEAGEMRIRLGSLEPTVVTEDFCRRLASCGNICSHFHLSLQSGCDQTLQTMNRKYGTERFYEACCLLREYFPGCGLTCDLITGFPGETEEDFGETLSFIEKCSFSDMHIFPYSRRPGTPADKMPGQCTNAVKAARAAAAEQVRAKMHREFLEAQIGTVRKVLFETEEGGLWQGHSENYVLVRTEGENRRNTLSDVRIDKTDGEVLYGTCI